MIPEFFIDSVKEQIVAHAEANPTVEVCGIILKDFTVIQSPNTIEGSGLTDNGIELTEETGALIDEEIYLQYEDDILCFYHTHWSEDVSGYLSTTDIYQSRIHGIPYLLYHTAFKVWDYYDPNGFHPAPLMAKSDPTKLDFYKGWTFEWGRSDCAALLRSYAHYMWNHNIIDYPRPLDGHWYKNPEYETAYEDLIKDPVNGFIRVNSGTPKKDDVVLMRWFGSRHASHAGIMVKDDQVLHIIQNRTSEVVTFAGAWKRGLHSIWRLA